MNGKNKRMENGRLSNGNTAKSIGKKQNIAQTRNLRNHCFTSGQASYASCIYDYYSVCFPFLVIFPKLQKVSLAIMQIFIIMFLGPPLSKLKMSDPYKCEMNQLR